MTKPNLRAALDAGTFICAPGIHDMISAVIANKVGFDFIYFSGYWGTASAEGLPDAGITTYSEMLKRLTILGRTSEAGIIADADTGFGGLLNVDQTVRGYERAGAAAIQIEDQEFPKKCGHTPFKRVIPAAEMVQKIKVAGAARENAQETLIIARTDAKAMEGFDKAVERGLRYRDAGADVIFVEALDTEEEMRKACERIDAPMIANMADGGRTPILKVETLRDIGYDLAIFPAISGLAAAAAVEKALVTLKETGTSQSADVPLFDFEEFNRLIGFPEVWEFEKKWGSAGA
ncbi:putative isocitrate lyase-family enzyme [Pseudooceanicola batsensis HTCC2597]|uniref:Putative isocitrate lyase-family enzyme n=1 Tax=Pseudooceanicola batsensis (strain ATCC BAA-863 / DSM 15984 / KCTC 12145 / HTCC2597) TaxID=252305 RepID=A3U0B1_PSEBH|nr:isocitrate lyase/PEP mutase family protein [Pseudooceanicola batsensis]EAQ02202.1 putative isocitrate lyase-family enzyme [Pseudooceanicola batsensis HTCC2597]